MTMGKGGVGKTTVAAAIAVELASRGHAVHLSTTDPAAHVAEVVAGAVAHLRVSRIDPRAETLRYTKEVMDTAGAGLTKEGKALLEEDLRSPCTEEIAVFRAFAQAVAEGTEGFVVLDTAPTGHTLLLLDSAEAYHREVLRTTSDMPEAVPKPASPFARCRVHPDPARHSAGSNTRSRSWSPAGGSCSCRNSALRVGDQSELPWRRVPRSCAG